MNKGILVCISGFSGAGKGTLIKKLMADHDNYDLSVSATTRSPREGEIDGREYFFISREEFERRISTGGFLEYTQYVGNYYGTPFDFVNEKTGSGRDIILEIEMEGAMNVKKVYPEALLIFVTTPDAETLRRRLTGRGTETREQISARLKHAVDETDHIPYYDYLLINGDLDAAVCELHSMIQNEHKRPGRNFDFIQNMKEDLRRN